MNDGLENAMNSIIYIYVTNLMAVWQEQTPIAMLEHHRIPLIPKLETSILGMIAIFKQHVYHIYLSL